ncbi:MAG: hypothetical protein QOF51_1701 [Chloroflexota bacterium]|jgi:MFS family permease|nr:hypothetical protein [Chloroflexota bacterium]
MQNNSTFGVFLYYMNVELGWSRTILSAPQSLGQIPAAITATLVGPLVDRIGARWIVGVGGLILGGAFLALATIQEEWQFFLYRGLVSAIGAVCVGSFIGVTISNWFVQRRGQVLGYMAMGGSLGSAVLPLAMGFVITLWGWRTAWAAQGVLVWLLVIPAVVFVRRRPEDVGLYPDGIEPGAPATASTGGDRTARRRAVLLAADVIWTRNEVLHTRAFWIMTFSYGIAQMAWTATNLHIVPYLQDLGYPLTVATVGVSLRAIVSLVGSPGWGYAMDRLPVRIAAGLPFVAQAGGMLAFLLWPTTPGLVLGLVLYGLGNGGTGVAQESIWAYYFGRLSLGAVRSTVTAIQILMGGIGPIGMGLSYDLFGGYQKSWFVLCCGFILAGALIQLTRRPTAPVARPAA